LRNDSDERTFAGYRIYSRGLFAYWNEKHFPAFIHESCLNFERIYVSAGKRGLQLVLSPSDLIAEIKATVDFLILSTE